MKSFFCVCLQVTCSINLASLNQTGIVSSRASTPSVAQPGDASSVVRVWLSRVSPNVHLALQVLKLMSRVRTTLSAMLFWNVHPTIYLRMCFSIFASWDAFVFYLCLEKLFLCHLWPDLVVLEQYSHLNNGIKPSSTHRKIQKPLERKF